MQFYPSEHVPPHFHATIAEFAAQIGIDPVEILKRRLPPNKSGLVLEWVVAHREPLMMKSLFDRE
ncbi:MAG: DUF4160 domain-containing protein [Hyphomicrobium sp.]